MEAAYAGILSKGLDFWGILGSSKAPAVLYTEFLQNVGNMKFDCSRRNPQYLANFLVRKTLYQAGHNLLFPACTFGRRIY